MAERVVIPQRRRRPPKIKESKDSDEQPKSAPPRRGRPLRPLSHTEEGIEQPVSAILQEEEPRRKPPRSQDQTIKKNGPTLQKSQGTLRKSAPVKKTIERSRRDQIAQPNSRHRTRNSKQINIHLSDQKPNVGATNSTGASNMAAGRPKVPSQSASIRTLISGNTPNDHKSSWKRKQIKPPKTENQGAEMHSNEIIKPTKKHDFREFGYLSSREIREMAEMGDEALVKHISQNDSGFLASIKNSSTVNDPKLVRCFVKILYKLVESREDSMASLLLSQIFGLGSGCDQFIFKLDILTRTMACERLQSARKENVQALGHIIRIAAFCIERIPSSVVHSFPIYSLCEGIKSLLNFGEDEEKAFATRKQEEVNELQQRFQDHREETLNAARQKPQKMAISEDDIPIDPPEHFTTVEMLPKPEEIYHYSKKPFLRANIVEGKYESWEHYLDVQFRLLREDFVGPLREGISNYVEAPLVSKGIEVYVYQGVMLGGPVCLNSEVGFDLWFDSSGLRGVNWEYTKRLINGSLLCLSTDNFESIVFVTVADRKPDLLKKGIITVKFEGTGNGFQLDPQAVYTMVESVAYFEAYRHVLNRLQTVSTLGETHMMPFKQYIVECSFDPMLPPPYLQHMPKQVFNLKGIIEVKSKKISTEVNLTKLSTWPSADDTDLDHSQMEALKAALTQDLSVIQGPPGTGKTYIGIKVVQAFLANKSSWDPRKSSPILVVCYTNHALDQFLEGIRTVTVNRKQPNITRIGGRCKTEELKNCVLYEKVSKARELRLVPRNIYQHFSNARKVMVPLKNRINHCLNSIHQSRSRLLRVEQLQCVMYDHHYSQLTALSQTKLPMEVWLGLRYLVAVQRVEEGIDEQQQENQAEEILEAPQTVKNAGTQDEDNEVQRIQDDRFVDEDNENLFELPIQDITLFEDQTSDFEETGEGNDEWKVVQMSKDKRERQIRYHLSQNSNPMTNVEADTIVDVWSLNMHTRWRLYLHWRDSYMLYQRNLLERLSERYKDACSDVQKAKEEMNLSVVKGSDVVGMTTTGAAKHNYIIKGIRPKIVIVEEAAEIFEAHIFTSLSPSVQQLILIGDHEQLRPKPTYFELEKNYKLDVSLFERLSKNKCPVKTLGIQHRMRPEIASLITPTVYPDLQNHESVEKYEHIQGVDKSLFFLTHTKLEVSGKSDTKSHSNPHEAKFLTALCRYFIKQEYDTSQITILTLYRGQLLEIKKHLGNEKIVGVRTAVVDDFQGEENDIILLSLVRSNLKQNIGFVGIKNRICVALSRAKKGFFIIGNKEMLRDKQQTIWPEVISKLQSMDSIGDSLLLHCAIHRDQTVKAKSAEDFAKCPEGGCLKKCDARLSCGHVCRLSCHPYDRDHIKYKCQKSCPRTLDCGHKCTRKCHQCRPECQPCLVPVPRFLEECGHTETVACSVAINKIKCRSRCEQLLECGHQCQSECFMICTRKCQELVYKDLPCGHTVQTKCHILEPICREPCGAILDCGHTCSGTCGTCHKGRLHVQCNSVCKRILVCGHECDFPCSSNCPPCIKRCTTFCVHSKCQKKCFELCDTCQEPCEWSCPHQTCTMPCGEPCNQKPCNDPCKKLLKCGHECIGLCGEPCPSLCRICNKEVVTETLFGTEEEEDARFVLLPDCKHVIEVSAMDTYMSMESEEVSIKKCPKCTTPVKTCLRYGNAIKCYLQDIEAIKQQQLKTLNPEALKAKFKKVMASVETSANCLFISNELAMIEKKLFSEKPTPFPDVIRAQLTLLPHIVKAIEVIPAPNSNSFDVRIELIKRQLNTLKVFVSHSEYLSKQQISDGEAEMRRLALLARLTEFQIKLERKEGKISTNNYVLIERLLSRLHESGHKTTDDSTVPKITSDDETEIMHSIQTLCKEYQVDNLSEAEKLEIVEAMGLTKGHWFKCPQGHFYCIGECGGAMETAKCPECNAEIGGSHHQLLASNQVATEMDGAEHPAWSEMANMHNFDPQELALLQLED